MNLKNIKTFIYVAEKNSFTKAAEKLGYTQSAVSFQIKQLENSLGVVLFERVNNTIKLTAKGRQILDLAHHLIVIDNDIKKVAQGIDEVSGNICIAMADSLCTWMLKENYRDFHTQYPNITLKIISASTEEMFKLSKQNDVDLVFTLDKHIYDTNYVIAKEHPVNTHFVVPANHPLCKMNNITIDELLKYPFILTEKGMSYRRILEEYLSGKSIELNPFLEIGNTDLICHLVAQNMGISFLPDFVTEGYYREGKIERLDVSFFSTDIWVQMLYHRDKWITPEMKCVMDHLCSFL